MTATRTSAIDWMSAGTTSTVEALVLRFAAVVNGLHEHVASPSTTWFLLDAEGRVVDCGAPSASSLLGAPVSHLLGGIAAHELGSAWMQVLMGRAQTVWPWRGGRAKATMRSIELHPLRDVMGERTVVIGALVVMVDENASAGHTSIAA